MTRRSDPPDAVVQPDPVVLDGDTLTPRRVALIAREGAEARLAPAARARNDAARATLAALIESGADLYGVSTGVGALREHRINPDERASSGIAVLRSHAGGAGRALPATLVRAAMATRANQLAAGGAGVTAELLDALV